MKIMRKQTVEVVDAYVCDRCGREAMTDEPVAAEFFSLDFIAGYDSVFGDGNSVGLDICPQCLKEAFGAWMRIEQPDY